MYNYPSIKGVYEAAKRLKGLSRVTPLEYNKRLSYLSESSVFLKREDVQQIRSFKIRGAYNKIASLGDKDFKAGIVCASAGNHAQGVALSSKYFKYKCKIFVPICTPLQKISRVNIFCDENGEVIKIK